MAIPGYFVTGTDTGVGKTFVTDLLARRARASDKRVFAFKPIETGVSGTYGEDEMKLITAAGSWQRGPLGGVYAFPLPASPLAASRDAEIPIDLALIEQHFQAGCADAQFVLVEGAGGWRVPVTETADMALFAKRLGLPVLLVARATLGTINHTLLSVEAIARDGCFLAGVILSQRPTDEGRLVNSNVDAIIRSPIVQMSSVPVIVLNDNPEVLDRFT